MVIDQASREQQQPGNGALYVIQQKGVTPESACRRSPARKNNETAPTAPSTPRLICPRTKIVTDVATRNVKIRSGILCDSGKTSTTDHAGCGIQNLQSPVSQRSCRRPSSRSAGRGGRDLAAGFESARAHGRFGWTLSLGAASGWRPATEASDARACRRTKAVGAGGVGETTGGGSDWWPSGCHDR